MAGDGAKKGKKQTLPGMPAAPEGSKRDDDGEDESVRLEIRRSRVTMDFSGPPLSLPSESQEIEAPKVDLPPLDRAPVDGIDLEQEIGGDGPLALDLDDVGALDLVDRGSDVDVQRADSVDELDLAAEMRERFALDDFTGALRTAELLLGKEPEHAEAQKVAKRSVAKLEQLYTSRLGAMSSVPRVAVPEGEVRWLGLDHRAAFLLSRIDGSHTVEEIVDVSGMPRLEALKTLVELKDLGALALD